jgi:SAM-dependent methyltransferase
VPADSVLARPSRPALDAVFALKYAHVAPTAWSPRMRQRFGYFSPEDYYEALVSAAVDEQTEWLDVGCGRFLFPGNDRLARILAARCRHLTGVDPDVTIHENPYVHERQQATITGFETGRRFDLVTMRMVAEHVTEPEATVSRIAELLKPGGRAIVYTVLKWSPGGLLARWVPFQAHHAIKRFLWGSEEKDTFPVAYRMNTRRALRGLFERAGCRERLFLYADDCRALGRFRAGTLLEICTWRLLRAMRLPYPEQCIIGVYEK